MLSQYKCMVNGHQEQQIIAICENVNCKQQYRRVCFDCQQIHQNNDLQFRLTDIKNEKGIQKMFDEFQQDNINKINNIYTQCYIQQYFLTLNMIDYVEQYIVKYSLLANIIDDLNKFNSEEWKLLNVNTYIQNGNNIGVYRYLKLIQDKLLIIDQAKDYYLLNINNRVINTDLKKQNIYLLGQELAYQIPILQKNNEMIFQLIIKNDLYRKEQLNQNPFLAIKELINIQGQKLKTNILKEQYNQIQYLLSLGGVYEGQYKSILYMISILQEGQSKILDNKKLDGQQCYEKSIQFYKEGDKLYYLKKYCEAIDMYDQAIKLYPQYVDAFNNKGNSLHNLQRYQDAINEYDQAIKLDPQYVLAYTNKGSSLHMLKQYYQAIDMYDQAIKLDPTYVDAYAKKGISLNNLQKYFQAIEMFEQAIKLDPRYVDAYNHKGNSLYKLQRFQEAKDMYDYAIQIDPNNVDAYNNKGNALKSLQKYQEAVNQYEYAIQLDPKYLFAYNNKEYLLKLMGRKDQAIKTFQECKTIDPNKGYANSQLCLY